MPFVLRRRKQTRKARTSRTRRRRRIPRRQRGGAAATAAPWVILQYDNRNLPFEFKKLIEMNKTYAEKHGYTYKFESKQYPLPPYWIKVKLCKELLEEIDPATGQPKFGGVLFLDTDAVIVKPDLSLDTLLENRKPFLAGPDVDIHTSPNQSIFNAGVIVAKNTPEVRVLFQDWMNAYTPTEWSFNGINWFTTGKWAGPTYEQGSFVEKILPKHKDTVELVDPHILQAEYPITNPTIRPETFVIHFSHVRKNLQLPLFLARKMK